MTSGAPAISMSGNSFATQYTSLILIVLAFTVGALVKPVEKVGAGAPEVPPTVIDEHLSQQEQAETTAKGAVRKEVPVGRLVYTDLFEADSSALNVDRVDALSTVLRSHDLRADIRIFLPQTTEGAEVLESGLLNVFERSIALSRSLEARGVPLEAFRIRTVEQPSADQAEAQFYREGSSESP